MRSTTVEVTAAVMAALSGAEPELTSDEMRGELRMLHENADAVQGDRDGIDGDDRDSGGAGTSTGESE